MSFCVAAVGTRRALTLIAIACALSSLGTLAPAQNPSPKDEVFGGYSWLAPNGWGDLDYKINDIPKGFDASNTYYFSGAHNIGLLMDGSGHFNGATTPGNPFTSNDKTGVGYALFGIQYKYHTNSLSPFVRGFVGTANISPDCCHDTEWSFAAGGGGGLDLRVKPRFSIRLVQADYIYSNYSHIFPSTHPTQWNSVRLAAGVVINFGNYYAPALAATCSAQPTEVIEGEPITVTATGTNFNPKHTVTYAWTTNGGKLDTANAQSAKIDTTGVAAGAYTANATLTDAKMRKMNSAKCSAPFTVKAKPMNPPEVTCSANPTTVRAGTPSTITANATSPDPGVTISSYSYLASAGTISGTGTTATLDTTGAPAGPINVSVTATDSRGLTNAQPCVATVTVEGKPELPQVSARTPIQFIPRPKQKYIPWRVDNEAKAILDDDASALKNDPNAKLVIVGYADGEPQPKIGMGKKKHAMDLAAQRAVNAKAYL
ncbi:MAG TPA: hypothetical protein VFC29_07250, partial [Candidatus Limnocylindrales bacterium]|nr:hypothetical protein [Candidatus Limnocylindrales bacterium]